MVSEKITAAIESTHNLALGATVGSVIAEYRKKVRTNARRLSR